MSFLKKAALNILILTNAAVFGYFFLKITGRQLPADFVRPFIIAFLSWWAVYLLIRARWHKTALLWAFIFTLFQACTSVSYIYYQSIDSVFTGDDIVAIAQSNVEELYDFAEHYLLHENIMLYALTASLSGLITLISAYFLASGKKSVYRKTFFFSALIFIIASIIITSQLRPFKYYRLMVSDLQGKIEAFHELTAKIESASVSNASKAKKGELYVLVIGESLCRDNMGLYNRSIDNTPFLSKLADSSNTIVFDNAYSSFVNTVPSITASFSQGNLHTGLTFPEGENLISMAKKSGMKTYWISNQVKNGNADTPVGAISSLADYSYFTTNYVFDGSYSQKPDKVLLPELEKLFASLDSNENNFVIVHIMGNHSPYYNRYPENYPVIKINKSAEVGRLCLDSSILNSALNTATPYDSYLTAVKYNDEFLDSLYRLFSSRPDFRAFVYYSDHAEAIHYVGVEKEASKKAPVGRHNVAQFSYAMSRIPFIVNVSDSYRADYSQSFDALHDNKHKIVTNDTLYDFMLDLMQIESTAVNYSLSAASKDFDMGDEDKIFIVNNVAVSKDPEYIANRTALDDLSERIFIKSANSQFKANSVLAKGYKNLHVDTVIHDGRLYVKALSSFDDNFITPDIYLEKLYIKSGRIIFDLDDKADPSMLDGLRTYKNVYFMSGSKELYDNLKAASVPNIIYKQGSINNNDSEHYADICVLNEDLKSIEKILLKENRVDEALEIPENKKHVYVMSGDLNVHEYKSIEVMKKMPEDIMFIVEYNNAFNSDF